jgi:hypothetical protein
VWNIIVIMDSDYDRAIRHFFVGDDGYGGGGSGSFGYDDDRDYDDDDGACLGTNFDGSLCMEEVIGTNRLQTRTPSSFYTTGCLQRMGKGKSGNSACYISCGFI